MNKVVLLIAFAAIAIAAPDMSSTTTADRVIQLLADRTLLQGTRDTLELAQNMSRTCHANMQRLIAELLAKLASVKYELGNELKYPFPVSRLSCLIKPWANELFPELERPAYILEEVSKALCAQNYAVRCDATDIKPAGDTAESLPSEPFVEVNITLPPLPDLVQLKLLASTTATEKKKITITCHCP
jgi:hypothetical protein